MIFNIFLISDIVKLNKYIQIYEKTLFFNFLYVGICWTKD